jgi:hypothetical protein
MRVLPAPWPSPSPLRAHRQSRMGRTNRADDDDVAKISTTTTTTATALFLEAAAAAAAGSTIGMREQNDDADDNRFPPRPPPAIASQPERHAQDVAVLCPGGERGEKNAYAASDATAAASENNDDDRRKRGEMMVAAPMIAGAEARCRAVADRRRPGESLLFSSLEMNSEPYS